MNAVWLEGRKPSLSLGGGRKVKEQKTRPCSEELLGGSTNETVKKVERPAKVSVLSPIRSEGLEGILRRKVKTRTTSDTS